MDRSGMRSRYTAPFGASSIITSISGVVAQPTANKQLAASAEYDLRHMGRWVSTVRYSFSSGEAGRQCNTEMKKATVHDGGL